MNGGWGISYEIALRWMPLDFTDDKSTLVQVMAWCCQATSHYLSQCWPRSMSPNGVTRPQWVNLLSGECQITSMTTGNGLVLSGNKPLCEPMLIQIYVINGHHNVMTERERERLSLSAFLGTEDIGECYDQAKINPSNKYMYMSCCRSFVSALSGV